MEKISTQGLTPITKTNQPVAKAATSPITETKFRAEIEASLKMMEGITEKIKTNVGTPADKIDTAAIEADVNEARKMLDELTNTFASIKHSNEKSVATTNENLAIKAYQQNSNDSNKKS